MSVPELQKAVFSTRTKESACSRYSGNVTSVIQKFCSIPEILDQFFTSYRNAVHAHKQFIEDVWDRNKANERSRASGHVVFTRRKESACSRCSGNVTSVIQKFCSGPEILDQFFTSYRNAVHAQKQLREGV